LDQRTPSDAQMMPHITEFAMEPTPERFKAASQAYACECTAWPIWTTHCGIVLEAGNLDPSEIAYANCLPWRTRKEGKLPSKVMKCSAENYVRPLLRELDPRIVVAMGVKARDILTR